MKVLHSWLHDYLGDSLPSLEEIDRLFTFHAFEVEEVTKLDNGDAVIDVKVLPDRAADCLSHRGIAHELAAILQKPLRLDPLKRDVLAWPSLGTVTATITDPALCRRFTAVRMEGIRVSQSPAWLRDRLAALGQRSINNVVDITNYVMLATGQPLHAYDADRLSQSGTAYDFVVRFAKDGEQLITLSGDECRCTETIPLIASANGQPLGIAGVKGGVTAEISDMTTHVVIEAANFSPTITRLAAQQLRLPTDAAKRFENNISPKLTYPAVAYAVELLTEHANGELVDHTDVYPQQEEPVVVSFSHSVIEKKLGISIPTETVQDLLRGLGVSVTVEDATYNAVSPWWRRDLVLPEDYVADIGRLYGYDAVPSVVVLRAPLSEYNQRQYYSEIIRSTLVAQGFSEVITSSFCAKSPLMLANALASDKGGMRTTLRDNMSDVLEKNIPHLDILRLSTLRVFEIGTVFAKGGEYGVLESTEVALGVRTKRQGFVSADTTLVQQMIDMLSSVLGSAISPTVHDGIVTFSLDDLLSRLPLKKEIFTAEKEQVTTFTPYSLYPPVSRDVAFWVPETNADPRVWQGLIEKSIEQHLVHVTLFDEFRKQDQVSLGYRIVFQAFDRTLTNDEVQKQLDGVYKKLVEAGAIAR